MGGQRATTPTAEATAFDGASPPAYDAATQSSAETTQPKSSKTAAKSPLRQLYPKTYLLNTHYLKTN